MTSQQIFSVWTKLKVNKSFIVYPHKKNSKKLVFPLFLWTEVQPVHTPVRTQAYGPALSQSNVSILSVFFLVYNKYIYIYYIYRLKAEKCQARKDETFFTLPVSWFQDHFSSLMFIYVYMYVCIYIYI